MSRIYSIGNTNISMLEINDGEDVCIIVSVNPEKEKHIRGCLKKIHFRYNNKFPININYREPEMAGTDRVAFAMFAFFEGIHPSYLIDAGTFITVDFFDGKTLYPLATIPGFKTQLKSLENAFNLKNLKPSAPESAFPESPEESLYNGIFTNTLLGIKHLLEKPAEILITGGDAEIIKAFLKKGIIVKNAVHIGAYMAYKNRLI